MSTVCRRYTHIAHSLAESSLAKSKTTMADAPETHQEAPDIWSGAAHNKVPEDAWEYHTRKALNDAVYKGLDYVPYCSTMPVQPQTDEPKFMWKKKGGN